MNHGQHQFRYHSPCLGTVVKVYPLDDKRRLFVDVLPLDNRGAMIKVPVFFQPGWTRNMRMGQSVQLAFVDGNPQTPIVVMHAHNSETNPMYANPLPPAGVFDNLDDAVAYHDETGAFMRWRSRWSGNATTLSGPAQVDLMFASGMTLTFYEYDPDGYTQQSQQPPPPPPANRAKFGLTMPSGAAVTIDEPTQGQALITIDHPSGTQIRIAADGSVDINAQNQPITVECGRATLTATDTITLDAPDVELGGGGGRAFVFVDEFNAHTHPGVQSGGSDTAPPVAVEGTQNARAV